MLNGLPYFAQQRFPVGCSAVGAAIDGLPISPQTLAFLPEILAFVFCRPHQNFERLVFRLQAVDRLVKATDWWHVQKDPPSKATNH
ncbi:MAG: hypothetical protein JOZ58_14720 [Acetobacteraceae bacterium]|nr:hypothetical protein [Acetobacteraceae bacterium]